MVDDEEWTPPTPAQMKEIEQKRQRSDMYSKKMGEYLLKGWKMLNEYCPVTGDVPLMQNREGRKYSVALEKFIDEIETEASAPAPAPAVAAPAPAAAAAPLRLASPVSRVPSPLGAARASSFAAASAASSAAASSPVVHTVGAPAEEDLGPGYGEAPAPGHGDTVLDTTMGTLNVRQLDAVSSIQHAVLAISRKLAQAGASLDKSASVRDSEALIRLMVVSAGALQQLGAVQSAVSR